MHTIAPAPAGPVPRAADRPVVDRARGCWIHDENGRDYLDASSGTVCVSIGHGVREVAEAMAAQAERVCFAHYSQFANRPARDLSDEILAVAGPDFREVVYSNSGSEATEAALRLIMHHHAERADDDRTVVLTQYPSYHGMTAGALGISGHPGRRRNLGALHDSPATVEPVRCADEGSLLPGPQEWRAAFERIGPHRVAAVVVEIVGGAASGACVMPDETLRVVRELCDASGALLVADEVITGFGRTGAWFAHAAAAVRPDLVTTGKGFSAGYTPIGACLVGAAVLPGRSATEIALGHTMNGNPLSAATALAVLRYIIEHDLVDRAARTGAMLEQRLTQLAAQSPLVRAPRGRGLLLGLPVPQDPGDHARAPLARRIAAAALEHGLLVYPAGADSRSQAVLVTPPLTIEEHEVDILVARLAAALGEVAAARP